MIWLVPLITSSIATVWAAKTIASGPSIVGAALTSDQESGMIAINKYFQEAQPKTDAAVKLRDEWLKWYSGLDWWDIQLDEPTYAEARNRVTAFDRANATTEQEKAAVETRLKRDPTRLSTGFLPQDSAGILPNWVKPAAYGVGAGALGVIGFSIFRSLRP